MQIEITPKLLTELKEKAKKATSGDWNILYPKDTDGMGTSISDVNGNIILSMRGRSINKRKFNSEYIAAANPAVMLAIIAKIDQLEKEADWLAARLQAICKHEVPDACAMLDIAKCPFFPDGKIFTEDNLLKCKYEHTNWRKVANKAIKANGKSIT